MKISHILVLTFTALTYLGFQEAKSAPKQVQKRAVCIGILNTGSGMAGSRIGDVEGKSCFIDADSDPERAVQAVCKQESQCQVTAMVTTFRNGNMQIQKVISVREIPAGQSTSAIGRPIIPAFTVEAVLSPRAKARLAVLSEGLAATAFYFGDPTPSTQRKAQETGRIELGTEDVNFFDRAGSAKFFGKVIKPEQIDWVKDRAVQVTINVYSARRSTSNNILGCMSFQDSVMVAAQAPVKVVCKLIEEP